MHPREPKFNQPQRLEESLNRIADGAAPADCHRFRGNGVRAVAAPDYDLPQDVVEIGLIRPV